MNNDDLFEKARRLAELTDGGRGYIRGTETPVKPGSHRGRHEATMAELHIELRVKHMTSEQLDALLDFYAGDMGKSILAAQGRIRKEMSSILASSISNSTAKGVIVPKSKKSGGDDT
ncbi:MAG: DUF2059 domain-containing protein [Gammaproteobacteria bacterium]